MIDKLIASVDKDSSECWLWTRALQANGYGRVRVGSARVMVHRLFYELLVGPIPDDLEIDHLCRVRHCVNPAHMEPVTHAENMRRSINPRSLLTHCLNGHEFSDENTYRPPGNSSKRMCRTCMKVRARKNKSSK